MKNLKVLSRGLRGFKDFKVSRFLSSGNYSTDQAQVQVSSAASTGVEKLGEDTDTVQVEYRGKNIHVKKGSILRSAMLENGLTPHNGQAMYVNCRGRGACGTCAVQVNGKVVPEEWGAQEKLRLNLPPHNFSTNTHLRLACQIQVDGDLSVIKYNKFWGQGDEPLGPITEDVTGGKSGVSQ